MHLSLSKRDMPARIAMGAFILNSGLGKRGVDEEAAQGMHGMAVGAYPFLKDVDPVTFTKMLSGAEIALGTALLLPIVPSRLVGAGLTAFASSLLGMYLRTPGMRLPNSVRPSEQGLSLAKDVWLLGAGISMMMGHDGEHHSPRCRR
ncbi:hypothetical protein [Nocardiopsis sp. ATB16-24]|uniref:hypothetical protein n=1 Tax=Nocardiopsis sp. ATB16-24 TaxID=3019555 RepID=UPI002555633F|nr:hypothetical protein [Nocardiopsis sp. ATB16-24]